MWGWGVGWGQILKNSKEKPASEIIKIIQEPSHNRSLFPATFWSFEWREIVSYPEDPLPPFQEDKVWVFKGRLPKIDKGEKSPEKEHRHSAKHCSSHKSNFPEQNCEGFWRIILRKIVITENRQEYLIHSVTVLKWQTEFFCKVLSRDFGTVQKLVDIPSARWV